MFIKRITKAKIINSIKHGVDYLATWQQKDGSYLSLSSPNPKNFDKALEYHSLFSTALILSCLNNLNENPEIKLIKKGCADFLLSQKSKHWSFNYWARDSKEAKLKPYPDDLDDTFCALSALCGFDSNIVDGTALANVVTLLTATEAKVGGPYRSWLVPETAQQVWKDIDLAVNSNIAFFLSLNDINLPNLNHFIETNIEKGNFESVYYPSTYPVIYFISRFYRGKHSGNIAKTLLAEVRDNQKDNPLNTALAISSLLNFDTPISALESKIAHLIAGRNQKLWRPYGFCIDPQIVGVAHYSGSSALTTAFCLEALAKFLKVVENQEVKGDSIQSINNKKELNQINNIIIKNVEKRLLSLNEEFKSPALKSLHATLKADSKKQITLLPYFFKLSLGERGKNISKELLVKLGTANLFGWLAYTIYDNFLDEEGDPKYLSIANVALRELTIIFNGILPNTQFAKFFHKIMDQLDSANSWEVTHCRATILDGKLNLKNFTIPDYGDFSKLAERSIGHALTPVAILFALGFNEQSREVRSLLQFFKHYLIARQLNDDAHDWGKDLKMGHVNAVGALLLKKYNPKTNINLSSLVPDLQELFWYEAVRDVSDHVLENTKMARKFLLQCSVIPDQSMAAQLLEKYEKGAELALQEQDNTIKFLKSYKNDH